MSLPFNTEPYFDDYSEEKDFYRILFRPSYAVQARELTQMQTILQKQVSRFGDHVFKNGSQVIPGSVNMDNKIHFVKLEQFTGGTLDVTTYIETFKNKIITGEASGVKMRVVDTSGGNATTRVIADNLDVPTLYCKIEGTADDNVTNRLRPGENLIAYAEDNQIATNFRLTEDQLSDINAQVKNSGNLSEAPTTYTNNPSSDVLGYGFSVDVEAGIYYVDGVFVRNDALKLYVGRFTNTPSFRVGFRVYEDTITPEDDESILDNATGSNNFAAPGAHRYQIKLTLVKLPLVSTDTFKFIELVRVVEGRAQFKIDRASYSELEKTFARRTFDESGNYEVNKFKLSVREHLDNGSNFGVYKEQVGTAVAGVTYGDSDKFVVVVDPGKAYIEGYEIESTTSKFVDFTKAREINGEENYHVQRVDRQTIGLNVGNYTMVKNLYKVPSVNTFEKVYLVKSLQPRPASLRAIVSSGVITSIVVDDGGEGYTTAPFIEIKPLTSTGTGATATCTITNGKINPTITITNGGSNYSNTTEYAPEIRALWTDSNHTARAIPVGAAPVASKIVGTARVKSIQLHDGDFENLTSTEYKLGLFDISMFSGYSFEQDVKSIVGQLATSNFSCNISPDFIQLIGSASSDTSTKVITGVGTNFIGNVKEGDIIYLNDVKIGVVDSITTNGNFNNLKITLVDNSLATVAGGRITIFSATIHDPSYETLLFPVGKRYVKTLRGFINNADTKKDTTVQVRRQFGIVNTQINKVSFEVPNSNESFSSDDSLDNFLLINADTNVPVNIGRTDASITWETTTNANGDVLRKIVNFVNVVNGNYYLIATVNQVVTAAQEKTKVLTTAEMPAIVGKKLLTNSSIDLLHADIFKLISIKMTPGDYDVYDENNSVDITDRYTLDNGQRSTYYGIGKILLKPGYQVPSGAVKVEYEYFAVGGQPGNYFSVDSYTTASGIPYEEIPSYFVTDSATGKKVATSLTDVIDFRPVLCNTNYFYPEIPMIGSDISSPVANYVGRIDKIVLDSVGKFNVIAGVPSSNPREPQDPIEGMVLATVSIPPYTKNVKDIFVAQRDNRRYTMRDIGKLERRIANLEYYVTLSLLEKDTETMQIRDETTQLDRFKNGFIVDQFTGHGIGDVKNEDYRISIDEQSRVLRPMHDAESLDLVEQLSTGADRTYKTYQKTGDLITLPYTEGSYIFNNYATRSMDIHAVSMGAFKGQITLFPEGDNWKSETRLPDLNPVDNNNFDAIKFLAAELKVTGTKWNEWQTNWTSVGAPTMISTSEVTGFDTSRASGSWKEHTDYETTYQDQVGFNWRDGIQTDLTSTVNAQTYGDRVVDISYIPYMRARPVTVIAQNLKNTTRFWPFFDNVSVADYCKPADKFVVTRVGQNPMSFDLDDMNNNVLADSERRAYQGRVEKAFAIGDVLTNLEHQEVSITTITNIETTAAATFSLTLSDVSNIRVGHHVILFNLNNHNAFNEENLNDLHENQVIGASDGILDIENSSAELNLKKFVVTAVNGYSLTLGNIDGSLIQPFSPYLTASYETGKRGKLLRLKASGVVALGGPVITADSISDLTQEINLVNVKNGFSIGETLTGSVIIGNSTAGNTVTVNSINGQTSASTVPVMKATGDSVITDTEGSAVCVFYIPETDELSFRTGERTFKLTDNQSNSTAAFDSVGSAVYYSQGVNLSRERTIVSTRTAQFVQSYQYQDDTATAPLQHRTTSSKRAVYVWYDDPLAQTFTVSSEGGAFISSIDLYFAAKGTRPVSIEVRNTDLGIPSSKVVPFSQVTKTASELNLSDDSSAKTTFKFKSPIYLQDSETYAFVVMTDEPGTQVYVSEMGSVDMLTNNTIAGQPLTGSLYASQNAKEWEIHPLLDMKFSLNKATFDVGTSSEVLFRANPPELMTLSANPFQITNGSNLIRVFARNHGFKAGEKVVIGNLPEGFYGANSTTLGIPHTLLNTVHTVHVDGLGLDKDSFVIDLVTVDVATNTNLLSGTNADFINGEYGGLGVTCSRSINMDTMYLKTSDLSFQDTKIEYFISSERLDGTFTDFLPFVANTNYNFPTRMHIASYENQSIVSNVRKSSLQVKAVLTSTNANVSPAIDLQQVSAYAISNLINNKTSATINVPEIDTRDVLTFDDLAAADLQLTGTGNITTFTSNTYGTPGTGIYVGMGNLATSFSTQIVPGAGNKLYRTSDNAYIGTVLALDSSVDYINNRLTLTGASAIAVTNEAFYIKSTPSLVFENVNGVGVIRTNIDTADNLLASAGFGKTMIISGVDPLIDGSYVVRDISVVEDKTTYAGNAELDTTKVTLDRAFGTTATIDMIDDADFSIKVLEQYVDDYAPTGSHNAANYITRTLSLTNAAELLKIVFDANIVNNTSIKVFYRTWTGTVDLRKLPYKDSGFVSVSTDPEGKFVERTIDITNLASFNNVQIKIVMKSNDPVFVPKVKNLRLLALS